MSAIRLQIHSRFRQHMGLITSLADFESSEAGAFDAGRLAALPPTFAFTASIMKTPGRSSRLCPPEQIRRAPPSCIKRNLTRPNSWSPCHWSAFCVWRRTSPSTLSVWSACTISPAVARPCSAAPSTKSTMSCHYPSRTRSPTSSASGSLPQSEQVELLLACVAWLCRPAVVGDRQRVAIKFRNQAISLMRAACRRPAQRDPLLHDPQRPRMAGLLPPPAQQAKRSHRPLHPRPSHRPPGRIHELPIR